MPLPITRDYSIVGSSWKTVTLCTTMASESMTSSSSWCGTTSPHHPKREQKAVRTSGSAQLGTVGNVSMLGDADHLRKIGDKVDDARHLSMGAWLKAKVVKVMKEETPLTPDEATCSSSSFVPESHLFYYVVFEEFKTRNKNTIIQAS